MKCPASIKPKLSTRLQPAPAARWRAAPQSKLQKHASKAVNNSIQVKIPTQHGFPCAKSKEIHIGCHVLAFFLCPELQRHEPCQATITIDTDAHILCKDEECTEPMRPDAHQPKFSPQNADPGDVRNDHLIAAPHVLCTSSHDSDAGTLSFFALPPHMLSHPLSRLLLHTEPLVPCHLATATRLAYHACSDHVCAHAPHDFLRPTEC